MKSIIIKPKNEILKRYIQYFLFFKKTDRNFLNYTTFPNNNLCLAIYRGNTIDYTNLSTQNNCSISSGNENFTSRLYGFHKMPFNVTINSYLDQICIIFHPSALRAFTCESYADLLHSDNAFDLFTTNESCILEQLFDENDLLKKAFLLEQLLLKNVKYDVSEKLKEALHIISKCDNDVTVERLAQQLGISTPSLFRLFKNNLGQNPKSYLKTIRFRNVLSEILSKQNTLTSIAHLNQFYDQAHCINDFKAFSGYSPKQLFEKVSVQQDDLAWIYNKK